jgi:hypothetical protein
VVGTRGRDRPLQWSLCVLRPRLPGRGQPRGRGLQRRRTRSGGGRSRRHQGHPDRCARRRTTAGREREGCVPSGRHPEYLHLGGCSGDAVARGAAGLERGERKGDRRRRCVGVPRPALAAQRRTRRCGPGRVRAAALPRRGPLPKRGGGAKPGQRLLESVGRAGWTNRSLRAVRSGHDRLQRRGSPDSRRQPGDSLPSCRAGDDAAGGADARVPGRRGAGHRHARVELGAPLERSRPRSRRINPSGCRGGGGSGGGGAFRFRVVRDGEAHDFDLP